jgi:hypothetical protein
MDNATKVITEIGVASVTIGAFMDWLTPAGALVGLIYYTVKLWETETVKILTGRQDIL